MERATSLRVVELRRAILLFAIVLGLAAIATSLQRPATEGESTEREPPPQPTSPTATARPQPAAAGTLDVAFEADLQPETQSLPPDRAATVTVTAQDPGEVEIPRLGLTAYADSLAPARLDVLPPSTGNYAVFFDPTGEGARRKIGVLDVGR